MKYIYLTLLFMALPALRLYAQEEKFDKILDSRDFSKLLNQKLNYNSSNPTEPYTKHDDEYDIVKQRGKWGIYNVTKEKFYIKPQYDSIAGWGNALKAGKWGNVLYGDSICEPNDHNYTIYGIIFVKNGKFGLKDVSGKTLLKAVHDGMLYQDNGMYFYSTNGRWGMINTLNKEASIPPKYDFLVYQYNKKGGQITAYKNQEKLYFDLNGKPGTNYASFYADSVQNAYRIIPYKMEEYKGGLAYPDTWYPQEKIYRKNGKYGLTGMFSDTVSRTPPLYETIEPLPNNKYIVKSKNTYAVIKSDGTTVMNTQNDRIRYIGQTDLYIRTSTYTDGMTSIMHAKKGMVYPFGKYDVVDAKGVGSTENATVYILISKSQTEGRYTLLRYKGGELATVLKDYDYMLFKPGTCYVAYTSLSLGKSGLYNMLKDKDSGPVYNAIANGPYVNQLLVAHNSPYYNNIAEYNGITPLKEQAVAFKDNFYIVKDAKGMHVADANFKPLTVSYPKMEFLDVPDLNNNDTNTRDFLKHYLKIYSAATDSLPGLLDIEKGLVIKPGTYTTVTLAYDKYGGPGGGKNYTKRVFVAERQLRKNSKRIGLYQDGKELADINVPEDWTFTNSVLTDSLLSIYTKDSLLLYNTTSKHYILRSPLGYLSRDSYGYMVKTFDTITHQHVLYRYDTKGRQVAQHRFLSPPDNTGNYIILTNKKDGKYALLAKDGRVLLPYVYDAISIPHNMRIVLKQGKKYGLVNGFELYYSKQPTPAEPLLPYDFAEATREGAIAKQGTEWLALDHNLNEIFRITADSLTFRYVPAPAPEYARVNGYRYYKDGLQGLIDGEGNILMSAKFKMAYVTEPGLFYVSDGTTGYITDSNGNRQIPHPVKNTYNLYYMPESKSGFYLTSSEKNSKTGLYKGLKELLPPEYDSIHDITEKYILAYKSGRAGIVNYSNKVVVSFEYDSIEIEDKDKDFVYFKAWKSGKAGIINAQNVVIAPFVFNAGPEQYISVDKEDDGSYTVSDDNVTYMLSPTGTTLEVKHE